MPTVTLLALGLSVLLALTIGLVTWRQRPQPGTTAFSVGMGGLAWLLGCMLIGNGAAAVFDASDVTFAFLRLKWLGTNVMVLGWFFFALAYTGREEYVTRRVVAVASVVPAVSGVFVLASDRFPEILASAMGLSLTLPAFDLWMGWERIAVAYIYALVLAGGILIVGMIIAHKLPHPELAGLWVLAISVPLAVNVSYLAGILAPLGTPEISVDPTPLAFLLTGTMGLAAILRYDSFEKAPVARTYVVDELRAGVLVYDEECRIVDHNEWVTSTLGLPADAVGRDVRRVLGDWFALENEDGSFSLDAAEVARRLQDREIELDNGEASTHLHVEVTPLQGPRGLPIGYSVLWYDVTAQKRTQRELEASNERLAYERDLKEQIRDTLITTSTQSELERAFCNSAVGQERVLAWVGGESAPGEVAIRTSAIGDGGLDGIEEYPETTPLAERTLETGTTEVVDDLETIDAEWVRDALDAGLRSGIAIPLDHNDLNYGVLCVFATDRDAFEGRERALLEDTAESLAFSIHAAVQRESLRSEEPMRVVFDVHDDASYLSTLANGTVPSDGSIDASEIRRGEEGDAVQMLTPTNVDPDAIREAIASHDAVLSIEAIGDESETSTIQVRVTTPTVQGEIADLGGAVRSTTVSDGRVRVVSEFSRRADLEGILARLREHFPGIELASRVYVDRSEERQPSGSSDLTEKQLNALRTAYASGFFHRPQRATANEVADALGVSRTTFLHHLRAAERSLFERMFEE
jgi:predicted DNA binding protein